MFLNTGIYSIVIFCGLFVATLIYNLFEDLSNVEKNHKINSLVNNINKALGKNTLHIGLDKNEKESEHSNKNKYDRSWADEIRKLQKEIRK